MENSLCKVHEGDISKLKDEVNDLKTAVDVINAKLPENLIGTLTKLDTTFVNLNQTLEEIKVNLIPRDEYNMVKRFVIGVISLISLGVGAALIQHVLIK